MIRRVANRPGGGQARHCVGDRDAGEISLSRLVLELAQLAVAVAVGDHRLQLALGT